MGFHPLKVSPKNERSKTPEFLKPRKCIIEEKGKKRNGERDAFVHNNNNKGGGGGGGVALMRAGVRKERARAW